MSIALRTAAVAALVLSFSSPGTQGQTSVDSLVSAQIQLLKDKNPSVRVTAAVALGLIGPFAKEAVPVLVAALRDRSADVRSGAARALGEIGRSAKGATPALIATLSDTDSQVRASAAAALGNVGADVKEAVPALVTTLKDPDGYVRASGVNALGKIGPEAKDAVPALIVALEDSQGDIPACAADALGRIGPDAKDAIPALLVALRSSNIFVQPAALSAIVSIAEGARDTKRTETIEQLGQAAKTLEAYGFRGDARRVQNVVSLPEAIQTPWYQRLLTLPSHYPVIALVGAVYSGLFLASLALLFLYPLGLLRISLPLEGLSETPTITKWIGVGEAFFVFGLFRYHPRVLDAWVAKYIATARQQFKSITTAKDREVHVTEVPVELDREVITGLNPINLREAFARNHAYLLVWGEGGSGKTSWACEVARWVMSDDAASRPCAQRMLPILIEQDLNLVVEKGREVLPEVIRGRLKELTGEVDAPPRDLILALLKRKRILLIADGLSELNEATRNQLRPIDPTFNVGAFLVTSRIEENLDGVAKTVIHPYRIKGNRLSSFMETYLSRLGKRELFNDAEFFEGCSRLSSMVGNRDTTVLLVKLYAEQMIATEEGRADEDMPENIPDLMLEYLNRLNRKNSGMDDRTVHAVAKTVAWECLRETFRPKPTRIDAILSVLGDEGETRLNHLEQKLRLVETIDVARDRIRFVLDPLAEYLAGMHLVDQYRRDEDLWRGFLARADSAPGAPEAIMGFLLAVRDCCLCGDSERVIPDFVADELAKRAGFDAELVERARLERRIEKLIFELDADFPQDRQHAADELRLIGPPANAAVHKLIALAINNEEDPNIREVAIMALGSIGRDAHNAVSALVTLLEGGQFCSTVALALKGIGLGAHSAIPILIGLLEDERQSTCTRVALVEALAKITPENSDTVVDALVKILGARNSDPLRVAAAESLRNIGQVATAAVPALTGAINEEIDSVRRGYAEDPVDVLLAFVQTLAQFGPAASTAVSTLRRLAAEVKDESIRKGVSLALSQINR